MISPLKPPAYKTNGCLMLIKLMGLLNGCQRFDDDGSDPHTIQTTRALNLEFRYIYIIIMLYAKALLRTEYSSKILL